MLMIGQLPEYRGAGSALSEKKVSIFRTIDLCCPGGGMEVSIQGATGNALDDGSIRAQLNKPLM